METTEIKRNRGRPQRFETFKVDMKTGKVFHNKGEVDAALAYKVFTELISGSMKIEETKVVTEVVEEVKTE